MGRFERWERLGEVVVRLGEKSGRERKYEVFFGGHLRGVATDGARTTGGGVVP
jgi:hypothetical protein